VSSGGAGIQLRADESVRLQEQLQICLEAGVEAKMCTKQLTHIVRVSG